VQDAIIAHLLKNRALASATDLVVGGASAGGLAVYLHADRWRREAGGAAQPAGSMRVTAMADSGFFLQADDAFTVVADGGFNVGLSPGSYESDMRALVEMANSSGGLNRACVAAKGKHAADCVFAQVSALFLRTPTFALQSAYDSWQLSNIMAPKASTNASRVNAFGNRLRKQLHSTLLKETRHGAFVDACEHHCFDWGRFREHGDNQAAAFAAWYEAKSGARRVWEEPDAFPCTACCDGKQKSKSDDDQLNRPDARFGVRRTNNVVPDDTVKNPVARLGFVAAAAITMYEPTKPFINAIKAAYK